MIAAPIVKWAGGKTRLLPELLSRLPSGFGRYYEPFAGGAALFFALAPERAVLGDANSDLIATYRAVASDVELVIGLLEWHRDEHSEAHYYATRELWNAGRSEWSDVTTAAAFLYLNRAGYNGLWRVNKSGAHNVPFGKAVEVRFDAENLRAASRALAACDLRTGDYRATLFDARDGDLVYLDPPYDATFNAYTSDAFDQGALAAFVRLLVQRGCHVVISNSDTPLVRSLYSSHRIDIVRCPRAINSRGSGRGDVNEVVVVARRPARPLQLSLFDGVSP